MKHTLIIILGFLPMGVNFVFANETEKSESAAEISVSEDDRAVMELLKQVDEDFAAQSKSACRQSSNCQSGEVCVGYSKKNRVEAEFPFKDYVHETVGVCCEERFRAQCEREIPASHHLKVTYGE
jgi:hypothetical protein